MSRLFQVWTILLSVSDMTLAQPGRVENNPQKILMVSAEQTGVFNTGGLGHTVSGLAKSLKRSGKDIEVLMPYYSDLDADAKARVQREEGFEYRVSWGFRESSVQYKFELYSVLDPETGLKTYLLKNIEPGDLFENDRKPGEGRRYTNHPQESLAFAVFNKVAAAFISRRRHTVINLHDWHAGYVGYYLREYSLPRVVPLEQRRVLFTISNFGYQGVYDIDSLGEGKPDRVKFNPDAYEFYGKTNFMKAGILDSDYVLTVSQNYLKEIFTERFSGGLSGFLTKQRELRPFGAITNGADLERWTPSDFSATDQTGKRRGKELLLKSFGLASRLNEPLFVMTSRLANQKGYDYLPRAIEQYLESNPKGVFVITGDGEERYVKVVSDLAARYSSRVVYRSFSSDLEKAATFYGDFFVNAAWYEPSGTNQMFAMRAGTIPLLSRVGGLPEYVSPGETGYLFEINYSGEQIEPNATARGIAEQMSRVSQVYLQNPEQHKSMVTRVMGVDHSWQQRVEAYNGLFLELQGRKSIMSRVKYPCGDLGRGFDSSQL